MSNAAEILGRFKKRSEESAGLNYLSFRKGSWEYGAEKTELEEGTLVVIDMLLASRGWVCWADGQVVEEIVVPIIKGDPPEERDLPDHSDKFVDPEKDGWSKQDILMMRELNDERLQFKFKGGSQGTQKAVADLCKAYVDEAGTRGDVDILPVVKLVTDSYRHKTYGKIPTPVFEVQSWMTREEVNAHFGVAAAPQVEEQEEQKKLSRK